MVGQSGGAALRSALASSRGPWPRSRGGCSSRALWWGQGAKREGKKEKGRKEKQGGGERETEIAGARKAERKGLRWVMRARGMPRDSWGEGVETTTRLQWHRATRLQHFCPESPELALCEAGGGGGMAISHVSSGLGASSSSSSSRVLLLLVPEPRCPGCRGSRGCHPRCCREGCQGWALPATGLPTSHLVEELGPGVPRNQGHLLVAVVGANLQLG